MSEFKTEVVRITVTEHPNADRLEIAHVGDYQSIVGKGTFQTGDLVAYIQEGSLVPEPILEELNLTGKLAGSDRNRVKAVRLRGVLSQGICYPAREEWEEGQDVSAELGITKYEPPIPTNMQGELYNGGGRRTVRYDIENLKRYPDVLQEGEEVVINEKIHGTFCCMGVLCERDAHPEFGRLAVSSKGLGGRGLVFKPDAPANENNLYLRAARQYDIVNRVDAMLESLSNKWMDHSKTSLFILGEVFGKGVQDLSYGADAGSGEIGFRFFDILVRSESYPEGSYVGDEGLDSYASLLGLERVPTLYRGPYSRDVVRELTDGMETVSGEETHIREGVVVKPVEERRDDKLGRVILKSVSGNYLTRKGGTEYN
jgi:RNA ligase (TIGR02306 family)